jgi:hypothetical protein
MKRVIIKNKYAELTNSADFEDPTGWINQGIAGNWWGLPQRNQWKDETSSDDLATEVLSEQEITLVEAIPAIPEITRKRFEITAEIPATETDPAVPAVWKWEEDCTPEEIAAALASEVVVIQEAKPEVQAVTRTQVTLRATYTIDIQDVTQEYLLRDATAHIDALNKTCDDAVLALLGGKEKTTIIAFALNDLVNYLNVFSNQSPEQIAAAKTSLVSFSTLFGNILALMSQRDSDIAAYKTSVGIQ